MALRLHRTKKSCRREMIDGLQDKEFSKHKDHGA
jgi:hypothetical protein